MPRSGTYDVVVIGAGVCGYVAAIRASQLGLKTACVEKERMLGGTCLKIGCFPSKALLESSELYHFTRKALADHGIKVDGVGLDLATMMKRKDMIVTGLTRGIEGLFRKNRIERIHGVATLTGPRGIAVTTPDGGSEELEAKHIVLATGSEPAALPGVPFDAERVVSSTEALRWLEVPDRLLVVGAGAIGVEIGSVWARLGSRVTLLEYMPTILPGFDAEIGKLAHRLLVKQGLEVQTSVKISSAKIEGSVVKLSAQAAGVEGAQESIEWTGDRLLVAIGRRPVTEGLGLAKAGVALDERGRIRVNERYETDVPGIFAVGDVIAGPMLAHKASEEGAAVAEIIAGKPGHVNYLAIPNVIYTSPEVAFAGHTEEELEQAGIRFRKGTFPFQANGRARALGETDGFVKILADATTDRILGAHILGPRAGDLIAELVLALEFSASSEDVARTSHAHPTLAEVVKEAALAVEGRAVHI